MPQLNYFQERDLSAAASDLVRFDADSIRQVASGERRGEPDVWVVDPAEYERNGRLLRDSESPRMLAYSTKDGILYATDGCNACARPKENELRQDLLEFLRSLINAKS